MQKMGVGTLIVPPMYSDYSLKELKALLAAAKQAQVEKIVSVCPIYTVPNRPDVRILIAYFMCRFLKCIRKLKLALYNQILMPP